VIGTVPSRQGKQGRLSLLILDNPIYASVVVYIIQLRATLNKLVTEETNSKQRLTEMLSYLDQFSSVVAAATCGTESGHNMKF
jgi:hypothetical protein